MQIRISPETRHPELVIVGGYHRKGLAEMNPHTLDLVTFKWTRWPGRDLSDPNPPPLPLPRQRSACARVTDRWLVVGGGSPESVRFSPITMHAMLDASFMSSGTTYRPGVVQFGVRSLPESRWEFLPQRLPFDAALLAVSSSS